MAKKKKKPVKKKAKAKAKAKRSGKPGRPPHLKQSKSEGFLESVRKGDAMVEYFTRLSILNPAAKALAGLNEPRREGGFVRLAHAREEFTAPVLTKGKSVTPPAEKKDDKKKK